MTALSDWLQRLETLHPAPMALGLDRISPVFQKLNPDFSKTTVVTVAGTNGKGSVVELLQNLLLSAGHRVGLYTSPHLIRYNERVRINGVELDDDTLVAGLEAVEACRDGISLTYFEFSTLAALHNFAQADLDYLVLEVGLGGRLDAVNIVDPDLCVLTSVALDHEAWLGSDREKIGAEKAGIFRPSVPVVCGDVDPPSSVIEQAQNLQSPWYGIGKEFELKSDAENGAVWSGVSRGGSRREVHYRGALKLLPVNIATALQAYWLLKDDAPPDWSALSSTVPGRQEHLVYGGVEIILDVSHNPAACEALAQHLQQQAPVDRCCALFAVMADKEIDSMVSALKDSFDAWFLGDLTGNERAKPARDLAPLLHAQGITMISVSKNMRQTFARAMSLLEPGHRLVVFGSVFTVAAIKTILAQKLSRQELEGEI
ncbi:dihydrofolate synthase/folylpolyglutamate synthase [Litorivivens lipolytica]|uniref:Dihydrofolate synthase/folylpolyglutamate synthase n=1 Tax=Litorivivens lipolytica TaxID=1524264 RepID=A0A7W4W2I7_9GAMM|nr:folylpolyglutamate synthase/dihydrofolate synthase family protein [Litorivivens lipolytica]MBB3046256.1 dihydrofolate synthase/folylpolyglutamate synthase [Litorivivens lipolytica]